VSPLLELFLAEARDLLEDASQGLVTLERAPDDAEVLNRVFRAFHTLKGSSGMFDLGALTRLLHAAEDILTAVRAREAELTPELVDLLLACTDRVTVWLASVAASEVLPPGADADAARLSARIRALLPDAPVEAAAPPSGPSARPLDELPPALRDVAAAAIEAGLAPLSVRYRPGEQCFFCGTDPLQLVRRVPGLLGLVLVEPDDGFASLDEADPFRCTVRFELVTSATAAELEQVFEYVADEVEIRPIGADAEAIDDRQAFEGILRDQAHLLGLPCDDDALLGRILGVAATVTGCLTQMRLAAEIPAWKAAVEEAAETRSPAALVALLARLASGRPLKAEDDRPMNEPDARAPAAHDGALARQREGAVTVKVALERIEEVMNLVGELIVAKNALPYLAKRAETEYGVSALARELADQYAVLNRIAQALQGAVMQVRMLPLTSVFQRFPRLVRDLARKLDKEVELTLVGEETEADKSIIDRISEPLIHLVRNSVDHGIEPAAARVAAGKSPRGAVRLAASHEGDALVIELSDDGRGLDPETLKRKAVERGLLDPARAAALSDAEAKNLIFAAGFSTAAVTSDISGRGVGMDVVRQTVEDLGGAIELTSEAGRGTTMRLKLPLTMAVTRVLMVRAGASKFGVPMDAVVGVVRRPRAELAAIQQRQVLVWRGRLVPLFPLAMLLDLDAPVDAGADAAILLLEVAGHHVGIIVDAFDADAEVVLKPLEGILSGCSTYHGTAILGDGHTLLILNPKELLACRLDSTMTAFSSAAS
jgi:two-component system chemotaxis sensor kinase CheA